MQDIEKLQISLTPYNENYANDEYDLDKIIFSLDSKIELLSSQADRLDYLVSISSGLICSALDILWVGKFTWQGDAHSQAIRSMHLSGRPQKCLAIRGMI
jgi:hypothetical protein